VRRVRDRDSKKEENERQIEEEREDRETNT
jgi:hypothetical protein